VGTSSFPLLSSLVTPLTVAEELL
jgi:hypothetical protein